MMLQDLYNSPAERRGNAPTLRNATVLKRWAASLLLLTLVGATGCREEAEEVPQAQLSTECTVDTRRTVDTFTEVQGQVEYLREQNLYLLSGGSASPERYSRLLFPCNLPEEFRKDGLQVVFSGQLKEVYEYEDLAGQPFKLTKLRSAPE